MAVARVCQFVREQESGVGHGYVLKLDISNCFPSIRRDVLWNLLKPGIADMPMWAQRIVHELLRRSPAYYGVHYLSTTEERATVPAHKRIENTAPGCGIPIGNLRSEERRVGKECVSTCRSRWSPYH